MAQLDRELNEMADKILNKESNMRLKSLGKRIKSGFSCFGRVEFILSLAIVLTLGAIALPAISRYYRKANKSVVSQQQAGLSGEQREILAELEMREKHWANVLVLIHPRDAKRAAEIINEVDKPNVLLKTHPFVDYEDRSYLVTRELEELLRKKNVRYQRKEYENEEKLKNMLEYVGANIHLYIEVTPFVNW